MTAPALIIYNDIMHTLFAYGTLIIEEIMQQVTGRMFQSRDAVLHGFARYRIRGVHYPGIIPREGSSVAGKLYFDICDNSLGRLDDFEDSLYERINVPVIADNGQTYRSVTYKVKDAHAGELIHEPWDLEKFRQEHITLFVKEYRGFYVR